MTVEEQIRKIQSGALATMNSIHDTIGEDLAKDCAVQPFPLDLWERNRSTYNVTRLVLSMRFHEGRSWDVIAEWLRKNVLDGVSEHKGSPEWDRLDPHATIRWAARLKLAQTIRDMMSME